MAENLIRSWWERSRGRLGAKPCPYRFSWVLDMPLRAWRAGPERIVGAFGLQPGQRVLEIGPGTGYYSVHATRLIGPVGVFVGIDIQLAMLVALRRRAAGAAGCPMLLLQGDASRLPIRSESADHVFMVTVLGEIPDRGEALREIARVLRPGARLSVSEQLPDPDFVTRRRLRRELEPLEFVEERTRGRGVYTSTWRAAAGDRAETEMRP